MRGCWQSEKATGPPIATLPKCVRATTVGQGCQGGIGLSGLILIDRVGQGFQGCQGELGASVVRVGPGCEDGLPVGGHQVNAHSGSTPNQGVCDTFSVIPFGSWERNMPEKTDEYSIGHTEQAGLLG